MDSGGRVEDSLTAQTVTWSICRAVAFGPVIVHANHLGHEKEPLFAQSRRIRRRDIIVTDSIAPMARRSLDAMD